MISHIAYGGWAHNVRLTNGVIDLVATLDVGPRILRLGFVDGPNVFKEFSAQLGGVNEPEWMIRGGHRLWHAPEAKPRAYAPDNAPVQIEELDEFSFVLTPRPEEENGVQKELEVTMSAEDNTVTVLHRLTNFGPWAIELAPWALTVMDAGGVAVVPLPDKRPHTEVVEPDFPLVAWPYTDFADPRLRLGSRYITLRQDAARGPIKFGMALYLGWAAYLVHGTLFAKYFDFDPCGVYPDFGCNFEAFTNEEMLEVESLGPTTLLEPGDTVEHLETWRLFADVPPISDEDSIDRLITARVEG